MDEPEWFELQPMDGCDKPQGEILLACNVVLKTDLAISQLMAADESHEADKGVVAVRVFAVECSAALGAKGCRGCNVTLTMQGADEHGLLRHVHSQRTGSAVPVEPGLVSTLVDVDKTVLRFGEIAGKSGEELEFSVAAGDFNRSGERRAVGFGFKEFGGVTEINLSSAPDAGQKRWKMKPQWVQLADGDGREIGARVQVQIRWHPLVTKEHAAATKIQAVHRGKAARKQKHHWWSHTDKADAAAAPEPGAVPEPEPEQEPAHHWWSRHDHEEGHAAAIKIQAVHRGSAVRRQKHHWWSKHAPEPEHVVKVEQ